jgi:hypothetical protein
MLSQRQVQKSSLGLLLLLLLLLGIGMLVLLSTNTQMKTSTQTASEGQCLASGQDFNAQQEAFTLAQAAGQYRAAHPFGGNYGLGSYTICYKDGLQQRLQSPVFKGYNNPNSSAARNATHSEQSAYGWLQIQLSRLSIDQSAVAAIYAVIFSQVLVCPACEQEMRFWQSSLRQRAKMQQVFLSIWDILGGKGFDPATYPAGNGVPVTADILRKVPIQFVP